MSISCLKANGVLYGAFLTGAASPVSILCTTALVLLKSLSSSLWKILAYLIRTSSVIFLSAGDKCASCSSAYFLNSLLFPEKKSLFYTCISIFLIAETTNFSEISWATPSIIPLGRVSSLSLKFAVISIMESGC